MLFQDATLPYHGDMLLLFAFSFGTFPRCNTSLSSVHTKDKRQLAGAEDICEQEVKVGFEPSFPFPCHLKFHINHIDQYISNLR